MLFSIIPITAQFITASVGYINTVFGDVILLVALVIGLPLAFWVLRKVISLVRAR